MTWNRYICWILNIVHNGYIKVSSQLVVNLFFSHKFYWMIRSSYEERSWFLTKYDLVDWKKQIIPFHVIWKINKLILRMQTLRLLWMDHFTKQLRFDFDDLYDCFRFRLIFSIPIRNWIFLVSALCACPLWAAIMQWLNVLIIFKYQNDDQFQ